MHLMIFLFIMPFIILIIMTNNQITNVILQYHIEVMVILVASIILEMQNMEH